MGGAVYYIRMINRYEYGKLQWVDLESPTPDEVRTIMEEFSLHPLVGEGLLLPTARPEAEKFSDHLYLVLHFPAFKHSHTRAAEQEIDFIIGKQFLITTRYDTVDPLHEFSKVFETNTLLNKSEMGAHAGFIFFHMMRHLYRATTNELEALRDTLVDIDEKMFNGLEREMVGEISKAARATLVAKRILKSHGNILASLEKTAPEVLTHSYSHYVEALAGEHTRLMNEVTAYGEAVSEMRETNNSLVSTTQNEIMKNLTIMAFITFPLSLFAALFGMNTIDTPLLGGPNDFWLIVGLMVMLSGVFFGFFRYKRWL